MLSGVVKALDAGLHCVVFSNNVPLEDERKMKELAVAKGLLCMGPDCGVANINGAALVLASINNRGPFGICGASGTESSMSPRFCTSAHWNQPGH